MYKNPAFPTTITVLSLASIHSCYNINPLPHEPNHVIFLLEALINIGMSWYSIIIEIQKMLFLFSTL